MGVTKIQIQNRTETGKNFVDKMRVEKTIPGVIYGRGEETVHITVKASEFARAFKIAGSASLLGLDLDGKNIPAIIKEIQKHPFKDEILHVDFQKINMDEKIRMTIPVILVNRDSIKVQPSILMQLLDEIDVECLPGDIPNSIEVDVEDMDTDAPILISDLDIAKNEDITILSNIDDVICTLTVPSAAEETDEESDEESEETVEESEEE